MDSIDYFGKFDCGHDWYRGAIVHNIGDSMRVICICHSCYVKTHPGEDD